ncbi:hypothetical protein, partial [Cetobacterium sp.]|uniref:hypothetical protein n=1 Tax=Cetobacterium sp. TaxID=2071632 RepID=UPI003F3F700A
EITCKKCFFKKTMDYCGFVSFRFDGEHFYPCEFFNGHSFRLITEPNEILHAKIIGFKVLELLTKNEAVDSTAEIMKELKSRS